MILHCFLNKNPSSVTRGLRIFMTWPLAASLPSCPSNHPHSKPGQLLAGAKHAMSFSYCSNSHTLLPLLIMSCPSGKCLPLHLQISPFLNQAPFGYRQFIQYRATFSFFCVPMACSSYFYQSHIHMKNMSIYMLFITISTPPG